MLFDRIPPCARPIPQALVSARGPLGLGPVALRRRADRCRGSSGASRPMTSTGRFGPPCSIVRLAVKPRPPGSVCFSFSRPATSMNTSARSAGLPPAPRPTRTDLRYVSSSRDRPPDRAVCSRRILEGAGFAACWRVTGVLRSASAMPKGGVPTCGFRFQNPGLAGKRQGAWRA